MRVDYGVRALVDLAMHPGEGPIQTSEIAARQSIPEPYLEQLLPTLSKFGFIRSRRGPRGGHELAREPADIIIDAVYQTLEGTSPMLDCLEHPEGCSLHTVCGQRRMWGFVEEAIRGVLGETTLADLANEQRKLIVLMG
jgi:Rrf2 family protein